tara:strand:+ start:31 stop:369 length:339 start_codon:yes stop_codon:yes gene_type:complete
MNLISTVLVWSWLLLFGLVAPTTLPAGGAQESIIQQRRNNLASPIIALKEFDLGSSPINNSYILTSVKSGTPVNVIKLWAGNNNGKWLLVDVLCQNNYQFFYKRGWVNIEKI